MHRAVKKNRLNCMHIVLVNAQSSQDEQIELYAYSLFQLTSLFFSTDHSNYARWMTYYALELANLKEENPELLEVLKDGAFSINRTGRPFSRVGIDMALEQTINAKSRLKGIVSFADVSTAVNRWIVTGSMRSQIINNLLEVADLKSYNSDNKELNKPRMERDKKMLRKLKNIYVILPIRSRKVFKEMFFLILRQVNKPLIAQKVFFLMSYQKVKKREMILLLIGKKIVHVLRGQSKNRK